MALHVLNQHQLLFQLHKINHLVQLGMFQQLHYSTNKSKYKYKSSFKYKSSGNLQFIFLNVYNLYLLFCTLYHRYFCIFVRSQDTQQTAFRSTHDYPPLNYFLETFSFSISRQLSLAFYDVHDPCDSHDPYHDDHFQILYLLNAY